MLKGYKILLTGLTGNLGGSIADALVADNELWGFARFTKPGQLEYWQKRGVHTVVGDCADGEFTGLPKDFDYVIHCAAANPPDTFLEGMRGNPQTTGLLMAHCHRARAFMHLSTVGVYASHSDPDHEYREDDITGATAMGHYEGTKLAAEGAVWAMSSYFNIPTIVCRLGVQYGCFDRGGLLGLILAAVLRGETVYLPAKRSNVIRPISDDDVIHFLPALLNAATVPPTTVNLAGDEDIETREAAEIFGKLACVQARIELTDAIDYPTIKVNGDRRRAIAGNCQVPIRDGITKMYHNLSPKLLNAPTEGDIFKPLAAGQK
jgi:nucleoside-diphosphate-sugar epimerase